MSGLRRFFIFVCCSLLAGTLAAQEMSIRNIGYEVNSLPEFPEEARSALLAVHAPEARDMLLHEPLDLLVVVRRDRRERTVILDFYKLSVLLRTPPAERKPIQSFPVTIGESLTKEGFQTGAKIAFHPTQPIFYVWVFSDNRLNEKNHLLEQIKQPLTVFQWRNNQAQLIMRSSLPKEVDIFRGSPGLSVSPSGDRLYVANARIPASRGRAPQNTQNVITWIPLKPDGTTVAPANELEFVSMVDVSWVAPWPFSMGEQVESIGGGAIMISSSFGPIIYNPAIRRSPVSFAWISIHGSLRFSLHPQLPSVYMVDRGTNWFYRMGYTQEGFTDIMQAASVTGSRLTGPPAVIPRFRVLAVPTEQGILTLPLDENGRISPRGYYLKVPGTHSVVYHAASGKLIYTVWHARDLR